MGQTFKFRIEGDKKALLAEVRRRAAKQGVNLEGDESSGQLSGLVQGSYEVSGDDVAVTIEKKPLIASWKMIESRVRQLFG